MPQSDLSTWLIEQITCKPPLDVLFNRFCSRLAKQGLQAWRVSIGFWMPHLGCVEFGNIGPAVNQASRLQDQTKILATPIVTSATFAAAAGRRLRLLGLHALRGVAEPVEIFAPL